MLSNPWIEHKRFSFTDIRPNNVCSLGNTSIAIAYDDLIVKYDWKLNEQKTILKHSTSEKNATLAFDNNTNTLYLSDSYNDCMKIFNVDDPDPIEKISMEHAIYPYLICIDGKLHSIGGRDSIMHQIYNPDKKEFDDHWEFEEWGNNEGMYWGGLIHVTSKQELLLFGGWKGWKGLNDIYKYSIPDKTWTLLPQKLPIKAQLFGCVLTPDEKYIIIFGGYSAESPRGGTDGIYIWELETMQFRQSAVTCPVKEDFAAFIDIIDIQKIAVYGYINNCIGYEMDIVPNDIIELIWKWCSDCNVQLLSLENGNLWQIKLNEILHS